MSAELTDLAHTIAQRVGRFLERRGLLERDAEISYLSGAARSAIGSLDHVPHRGGPQQARKVFTVQTLRACNEPFDDQVRKVAGADERKKLERLCRYISRPAVSEKRLSPKPNGNVRYQYQAVDRQYRLERPFHESGH